MITGIRYHVTKNDKQMAFVSLEDLDGTVDLVIFAEVLEKCSSALKDGGIVWVKGSIGNGQADRGTASILVEELLSIEDARSKFANSLHVLIKTPALESSVLQSLKELCLNNKGDCSLYLHLATERYKDVVIQANPDTRVSTSEEFISQIEQMLGEKSVWLGDLQI